MEKQDQKQTNTESEIVATPPSKINRKIIGVGLFIIIFLALCTIFVLRKYMINTNVPCKTNADCKDLPCSPLGYCPKFYCLNNNCIEIDSIKRNLPTVTPQSISPTNVIPSVISPTSQINNDWQTIESKSGYYIEEPEKGKFKISFPTAFCSLNYFPTINPTITQYQPENKYIICNKNGYSFKLHPSAGGHGVGEMVSKDENITLGKHQWTRVVAKGFFTKDDFGASYSNEDNGIYNLIEIHYGDHYDVALQTLAESIIATFTPIE